ncbi:MAG: rRNA maturation RNase YbeY [Pseudomonadota bacterium]|nr:rRNA maturation RNase YbeY [Pseudomonadota bacterium]
MTNMKNNIKVNLIDNSASVFFKPSETQVNFWLVNCLKKKYEKVDINLVLLDDDEMQKLNINFRSRMNATNVLSFPEDNSTSLVGEIMICPNIAAKEAKQFAKSNHDYFLYLFVHGILHLQGYDHIDDDDAELMETEENLLFENILKLSNKTN